MKPFFLFLLLPLSLIAAEIHGIARDQLTNRPINNAIVTLIHRDQSRIIQTVVTNQEGLYNLKQVAAGHYNIDVAHPNYYKTIIFDFIVTENQKYTCNIRLLKQKDNQKQESDYSFMIGSVEVQSKGKALIQDDLATTRKINASDIQHLQATNLGDVLNLVPGIEKSQNPGLAKSTYVGIRTPSITGTDGILEAYGTNIIIDNLSVSSAASANQITGRGGLDLRTIPADNIESVKVISGIPSVEFGDFSNGIIKVTTRQKSLRKTLKVKLNPDTKTASFSDGYPIKNSTLTYHLNYGYSERDLRKTGDEYQRLYGKVHLTSHFFNNKMKTQGFFTLTKFLDSDEPVGPLNMRHYREGFRSTGSFNIDYTTDWDHHFQGFLTYNYNRKKEFREKMVYESFTIPADTSIPYQSTLLSDTTVTQYIGKYRDKGRELSINGKFQYEGEFSFQHHVHQVLIGLETKLEQNTGDGIVLHDIWNYYGINSGRRSYSYDNFDPMNQISGYIEDNISGRLFANQFRLQLGLRYTAYNPVKIDFSNGFLTTQNGTFLNPRMNLQYFFDDNFRIRLGAGSSSKIPSLAYLYRYPKYYTTTNAEGNYQELFEKQENPDLQAYRTNKYEISVDWKFPKIFGVSLTGFYMESDDLPRSRLFPFGYDINPDTLTSMRYSIHQNIGRKKTSGAEVTLQTRRFYNLKFKLNVSYNYTKYGETGLNYDNSPLTQYGETTWYQPNTSWREKIIIDYQLNYISQPLSTWITLDVQQVPLEYYKKEYSSVQYEKEIDGQVRTFSQGMVRWWDNRLLDYSNRWLFNLRITKELTRRSAISFYVNNLFDDRAIWNHPYNPTGDDQEKNPEIYYGLEVSTEW